MKIELQKIKVRDLASKYVDNADEGIFGYGGRLDIRPPYQREFIYKDKQRDAVIDTIIRDYPLNVMYWAVQDADAFEVIDGQQRTISICQFVDGDFAFRDRYFHNLQVDEQERILNYELMVYLCSGSDSEKLEWFRTINIAGEKLTDQEMRNAVYSGSWVTDAKKYFSKNGCPAYGIGSDYLSGSPIRQDYLETAIKWLNNGDVENYMATHQHKPNAIELWLHFQTVIAWIAATFPAYRKEMKTVPWGELYSHSASLELDPVKLETQVADLMANEDVTNKRGIYEYVIDGREKVLNIRSFSPNQRREAYERQKGICAVCRKHFEFDAMEADHITPWRAGGKTEASNCNMLCLQDNRTKGGS